MPDNEPIKQFEIESLKEALTEQVYAAAVNYLQGAIDEDLRGFAKAIAKDAMAAIVLPEPRSSQVIADLKAQVRALGELNRVRAHGLSWDLFSQVTEIIIKTMLKTVLSVLPVPT